MSWIPFATFAPYALHNWQLGDNVKSRILAGKHLRITQEPGTLNDFGIYDHHTNPISIYTNEGREGYQLWRGRWKELATWDRDINAPPPDNLRCVHVSEVLPNVSIGARHGWLFTDEIEPRDSDSSVVSSHPIPREEEQKIKQDVQSRQQEIQRMHLEAEQWRNRENSKIDAYAVQIQQLKQQLQQQIHALEQEQRQAEERFWEESSRKSAIITEKERECTDIIHKHDDIHF
jgi:hypothetical protein